MSFIPVTPAGTLVTNLAADTKEEAIKRLLIDAAHMPYRGWQEFQQRGYTIANVPDIEAENPPIYMYSGRRK